MIVKKEFRYTCCDLLQLSHESFNVHLWHTTMRGPARTPAPLPYSALSFLYRQP